jgi:hypothetical protein
MIHLQIPSPQVRSNKLLRFALIASTVVCLSFATISAHAQQAPNQTHGFGADQLLTFTYTQNFDCVDQPLLDLDFNGIPAESDPNEMQTPICQPITEPTQDPTGGPIANTAHLYVLLPMFSVDHDRNPNHAMRCPNGGRPGELCGARLGEALVKFCGFIPEAWKEKVNSAITTQCPDPGHPVAGTCTMHASSVSYQRHWLPWARFQALPRRPSLCPRPIIVMWWTITS